MRILVTGGSGFIGSNLIAALAGEHEVANLDREPPKGPSAAAPWHEVDLLDAAAVLGAVDAVRPERVLHLAANTDLSPSPDLSAYAANIRGTENLISALAEVGGVDLSLYASSRLVFDVGHVPRHDRDYRATTDYGRSKVEMENVVFAAAAAASPWIIVRPTSIWGPWFDEPYRDFFLAVIAGRYRHPRGRQILKSFGYIETVVRQLGALIQTDPQRVHGKTLFLADYEPLDVLQWAEVIAQEAGVPPPRTVPVWALRAAARVGDALQGVGLNRVPLTSFRLANLVTPMVYDLAETEALVPDAQADVRAGVRATLKWLRETEAIQA